MSEPQKSPQKKKLPKQSKEERDRTLRSAYFDILEGYSSIEVEGEQAYIKHFDLQTQTIIDNYYQEVFRKAKSKGLLTYEESLRKVIDDGSWTEEEEEQLKITEKSLTRLKDGIANALNETMGRQMNEALEETQGVFDELSKKRESLVINTCEDIAERRSSDLIIKYSFYKKDKSARFFNEEEFDMLDRKDLGDLVSIYNHSVEPLNTENIQSISIADFFTSYYNLVESSQEAFFGRAIHTLTFFQVNLLNYAKLFSSILKNMNPPDHIKDSAKLLLNYAKSEAKKRKSEERKQAVKKGKPQTI